MGWMQWLPEGWRERRLMRLVRPYTMVGPKRLAALCELARRIEREGVAGDVVECGVCNGGSSALLGHFATHSKQPRRLWLFDSFEGMPPVTEEDGEDARAWVGQARGQVETVLEALERTGVDLRRTRIMKGWFEQTFPHAEVPRIALLSIDADWYQSVKLCLERFFDLVTPGGYVYLDDYGYWPGCQRAVHEFAAARGLEFDLQVVDSTGRWFRKPEAQRLEAAA